MSVAVEIRDALKRKHSSYRRGAGGILFFELATGTGYSLGDPNRIDAFHMEDMPSKGFRRTSYEIKISRSDFAREVRSPLKRRAAMRVSNQFYFVTPEGMLKPEEIPIECGLMELVGRYLKVKVIAPFRDGQPSSWPFVAAIARRAVKGDAA